VSQKNCFFYEVSRWSIFPLMRLVHQYRYYAIPEQDVGCVVVVTPHTSNADPFLVGAGFAHKKITAWIKVEFTRIDLCKKDLQGKGVPKILVSILAKVIVFAMQRSCALPIVRQKLVRGNALSPDHAKRINQKTWEDSIAILRGGGLVGIFPTGSTKSTVWKDSFLKLAKEAGVPLRFVRIEKKGFFRRRIIISGLHQIQDVPNLQSAQQKVTSL